MRIPAPAAAEADAHQFHDAPDASAKPAGRSHLARDAADPECLASANPASQIADAMLSADVLTTYDWSLWT